MLRFLTISLLLIPVISGAQPRPISFHSDFEKASFEQLAETPSSATAKLRLFFAIEEKMTEERFNELHTQLLSFNQSAQLNKGPKRVFRKVQGEFLQDFKQTCSMTEMFDDGKFNCVTGSAIMGFLLELNDFEYVVNELPHHVFLTSIQGRQRFILETTNRLGLLKDTEENRLTYHMDTIDNSLIFEQIGYHDNSDELNVVVNGTIDFQQLAGLAYYNKAVHHMNLGTFEQSVNFLQKAYLLYPSTRIEKALRYSLLKILNDPTLTKAEKKEYYQLITYHGNKLSMKGHH